MPKLNESKLRERYLHIKEVDKRLGCQINRCLKGKTKTAGGYEWKYVTQSEYEDWRGYNG